MAGKSTISITFKLDGDAKGFNDLAKGADGLKAAMTGTIAVSTKMKNSLADWSLSVQGIEAVCDAVGQLNDVFQGVIQGSKDFDTAMHNTNTMAGKSAEELEVLKDKVADVAKNVPVARDALAKGLYQVISNGVPEDNWMTFLEKSARSSVGGIADLEKVVTVTSTVIKNYGLAWSDAATIQDKIQLTAKNGVTSFEQLAEALPKVTGSAAGLGVTIDELMAVFATATGVTGNTAEVSTQLAAVLTALTKQSSMASKMAADMGIQFDAAAVRSAGGLRNFLTSLNTSINDYAAKTGMLKETIYANLFGSAEALRLLTSLTGQQSDTFAKNIGAMTDSVGTMDEAFKTAADTDSAMEQILRNRTAAFSDFISSVAGGAAPMLDFGSKAGMTMMSMTMLNKTLKANGLIIRLNSRYTKLATNILRRFSITTHRTGIAVKATSRNVKLLKFALVSLTGAGIFVALEALASAFGSISDKTDEANAELKELEEENKKWKSSLTDVSDAVSSSTAKEITKLNELYEVAKDETKSREERRKAIAQIQSLYPSYFSNINSEKIDIDLLKGSYEKLKDSIMDAARARAIQKKIEENTSEEIDLEMEFDRLVKEEEAKKEAYEKAVADTKKARDERRDSEEDMNWFQRSGYVAEPTTGRIGDDKVAASMDAETSASKALNAVTKEKVKIEEKLHTVQAANLELKDKFDKISLKNAPDVETEGTYTPTVTPTPSADVKAETAVTAVWHEQARTIEEIDENLSILYERRKKDTADTIADTNREIEVQQKLRDSMMEMGVEKNKIEESSADVPFVENLQASTLQEIEDNIAGLQNQLQNATIDEAAAINQSIQMWQKKADTIRQTGLAVNSMSQNMLQGWEAIKGIGSSIESISDALDGSGNAWQKIVAIIDGFIGLYQGISVVNGIIKALTASSDVHTASKIGEGIAEQGAATATTIATGEILVANGIQMASNKATAATFKQLAASKYLAAHADIPFLGFGIGAGYVAAMEALVASAGLPMLAEGGIASGPTLAYVGEYGGAASNPEVIAPLDKLRNLIQTDDNGIGGRVEFVIEGRRLKGILDKENNYRRRS